MTVHSVHPADLSAYHDGELRGADLRRVEEHLTTCAECRGVLAQYGLMAETLRQEAPEAVPLAVDHRVRAIMRAQRKPAGRSWLSGFAGLAGFRPAVAGVAIAALLLVVVMAGLPFGGDSNGSRVASAYLSSEEGRPTIEVRFTGPVDRASVEHSVRLDPPVEVSVTWRGDTMVVKPEAPLHKAHYVLSLNAEGPSGKPAPVAFNLPPAPVSTPLSLPTTPPAAAAPPSTATPTTGPAASPTPSPKAEATPATVTPTAQRPSPTPGPIYPVVRGFGLLLRGQPAIAASLGAALEAERPVEAMVQSFQKGLMLRRSDRKEIYAVVEGWGWRSYPDSFEGAEPAPKQGEPARGFGRVWREQSDVRSALGSPTKPEAQMGIVVQQFERGQLIWTADRNIYVLFESGAWDRYADSFQDATPTPTATSVSSATPAPTSTASPSPSATPTATAPRGTATTTATPAVTPTATPTESVKTETPTATPTATPAATATATPPAPRPTATQVTAEPTAARPTPEPASTPQVTPTPQAECAIAPARGFGLIYNANPALPAKLGCPVAGEASIQIIRQTFEGGLMIWRSDTREIVVIRRDGEWTVHGSNWKTGEALADAGTAPSGAGISGAGLRKAVEADGDPSIPGMGNRRRATVGGSRSAVRGRGDGVDRGQADLSPTERGKLAELRGRILRANADPTPRGIERSSHHRDTEGTEIHSGSLRALRVSVVESSWQGSCREIGKRLSPRRFANVR